MNLRALFETSLGQFALGAVGLVIGGALLFALVGAVSDGDDPLAPIANEPTDAATTPTDPVTDDTDSPTDASDPATDPSDAGTGDATDTPTDTPTDAATDTPPSIDPSSVSIQVLDAVLDDGRANHGLVVDCLTAAGYSNLIASNRASRVYETTTVFFTPGGDNETAAQEVAAAIGVSEVEAKPDNLSDTVSVHVVVGQDATAPC